MNQPHSTDQSDMRPTRERRQDRGADREFRVLQLSMRNLDRGVAYALPYEFEDIIRSCAPAWCVAPGQPKRLDGSRQRYRLARMLGAPPKVADRLALIEPRIQVSKNYELFVATLNNPWSLFVLQSITGWKKRCRHSVCFITEAWIHHLPPDYLMELLEPFDHVFIGLQHAVDTMAQRTGKLCSYLPLGCDVLRFAPAPHQNKRVIDVCNIGRRSEPMHAAFLQVMRERDFFYYYDTIAPAGINGAGRSFKVDSPAGHRVLLSSLLKRSRYFIANRARINEPQVTGDQHEISGRFYEGIAAGTVMLGVPPEHAAFQQEFDWPGAVIPMAYDCNDPLSLIDELDADPERIAQIRKDNVRNAALRHDWLYRLQTVFDTVGIEATQTMHLRRQRLQELAAQFE